MRKFNRLGLIMLSSTAAMALAGCDGASSVASPGEGTIVIPAPAPSPTPTPSTPTPTPGTPAASCPTGFNDGGVVGTYRACRLPSLIAGSLSLAKLPGVAYEINGRVDVGVDAGGTGTASTQTGILNIAAGVLIFANTTNSDNDYLIVNRGSRIAAEGTETQPIVFTAQQNLTGGVTDESAGPVGRRYLGGPRADLELQPGGRVGRRGQLRERGRGYRQRAVRRRDAHRPPAALSAMCRSVTPAPSSARITNCRA